jgi:hypothetical protein
MKAPVSTRQLTHQEEAEAEEVRWALAFEEFRRSGAHSARLAHRELANRQVCQQAERMAQPGSDRESMQRHAESSYRRASTAATRRLLPNPRRQLEQHNEFNEVRKASGR